MRKQVICLFVLLFMSMLIGRQVIAEPIYNWTREQQPVLLSIDRVPTSRGLVGVDFLYGLDSASTFDEIKSGFQAYSNADRAWETAQTVALLLPSDMTPGNRHDRSPNWYIPHSIDLQDQTVEVLYSAARDAYRLRHDQPHSYVRSWHESMYPFAPSQASGPFVAMRFRGASVPEPGTYAMAAIAGAGLVWAYRRRNRGGPRRRS